MSTSSTKSRSFNTAAPLAMCTKLLRLAAIMQLLLAVVVSFDWYHGCSRWRNNHCSYDYDKCYYVYQKCDGQANCKDNSDETGCTYTESDCPWAVEGINAGFCFTTKTCVERDNPHSNCTCDPSCIGVDKCCGDGRNCYSPSQRCDKFKDCISGDDERDCPQEDSDEGMLTGGIIVLALLSLLPFSICICLFCYCMRRRQQARFNNQPMVITGGGGAVLGPTQGVQMRNYAPPQYPTAPQQYTQQADVDQPPPPYHTVAHKS